MTSHLFAITGHGGTRLLHEITTVLAQRQVPVVSLNTMQTADACRVHLVVDLPDASAAALLHKRLDRIVGVHKTVRLGADLAHQRRSILARVNADAVSRGQVTDLVRSFGAEVVEVTVDTMTVFFAGEPTRVDQLAALLASFGTQDVVHSATVAVPRADRSARNLTAVPAPHSAGVMA